MDATAPVCQVVRTLDVIGEKWSLLIIRDALRGRTRFSEFRESLGAPTDILTSRLRSLVEAGILDRRAYREPGDRERFAYHLTPKGDALRIVIAAMLEWSDEFDPAPQGRGSRLVAAADDASLRLAFVTADGTEVARDATAIAPGPAARTTWEYRTA